MLHINIDIPCGIKDENLDEILDIIEQIYDRKGE